MKKILLILMCAAVLSAVLTACTFTITEPEENSSEEKLNICATLFPQYDFARAIAGDKANTELLLPLGTDSHSFDPSMQDVMKMENADIFIYTGSDMEPWSASFAENAADDCVVLDVSSGIEKKNIIHDEHGHNADPHIWTSPANAIIIAKEICAAICEADSENSEYYRENAEKLISELSKLDEDFRTCAENAGDKKLYFGGEFAFLYLTEEYGFNYISLYDSCSEHAEPGAKKLNEIIEDMKENKADIIFYPELSQPTAAENIAKQTGAHTKLLHSCHNLSKEDFEAEKTYVSIMRENLEAVKEALM